MPEAEAPSRHTETCEACGAEIVVTRSALGKPVHLDPTPERLVAIERDTLGELAVGVWAYRPHSRTCDEGA